MVGVINRRDGAIDVIEDSILHDPRTPEPRQARCCGSSDIVNGPGQLDWILRRATSRELRVSNRFLCDVLVGSMV